ncbi:MAG: GNAT family N-acetyltransferase [Pseudomonadota bacterium]
MELQTARLRMRSLRKSDVDPYSQIVADTRTVAYLGDGQPHSRSQANAYIADCIARENSTGITRFAIELRETEEFIGFSGFKEISGWIDFGYRFSPEYWGKGYATEAGAAAIKFGWDQLHLDEVVAGVAPKNFASLGVLTKLGFQPQNCPNGLDRSYKWFGLRRPTIANL